MMTPPTPLPMGAVAWDDAATRRSIKRYGIRGLLRVLVGVCVIVVALVIGRAIQDRGDRLEDRLADVGRQTVGVIVDVSNGSGLDSHIDVRLVVDGTTYVEQIDVDRKLIAVYEVGDEITVTYDPDDPSILSTFLGGPEESTWPIFAVGVAAFVAIGFVVVGLIDVFVAAKWRRLARREQWRREAIGCKVATRRIRGRLDALSAIVLCRPNGPDPQVCGVAGGRRARRLEALDEAWFLGDLSRRAIIAAPGPGSMFRTIPGSRRLRDRWLRALGRDDLVGPPG